jgi:hypothetical protein
MDQTNNSEPQAPKHVEPKSQLQGLEGFFDTYLREKAPFQLPAWVREWIVKYSPWIILIVTILGALVIIPLLLVLLGLKTAVFPAQIAGEIRNANAMRSTDYIYFAFGLGSLILEAMAIPKLFKRQLAGWKLLFYAALVSAAGSILSFDVIGLILGLVISMYILFQIRSYYR